MFLLLPLRIRNNGMYNGRYIASVLLTFEQHQLKGSASDGLSTDQKNNKTNFISLYISLETSYIFLALIYCPERRLTI